MSHKYFIIILIALGLLTRFMFFGQPNSTVFDEVHFGKFVSAYYTHQYYYDIHPPLGKLIIAGFAKLFGYNNEYSFGQIGDKFQDKTYMAMRFLPTLAGAFLPLAIYFLALKLGLKNITAFFAGLFIVFDNAFLTQSRLILMDSFLYLFGVLSLVFYFKYKQNKSKSYRNLIIFSILSALAASIKWTGLTFLALAGLFELFDIYRSRTSMGSLFKSDFPKLIIFFAVIPFLVYFSFFVLHFALLPKSGPGDAFMDVRFQATLSGNYNQNGPSIKPMNLFEKFIDLNKQMYLGNARLTATHPYGSKWYTWPFMSRPIYYWVLGNARIYYFGNPIIWWSSTIAMLTLLINYLAIKTERNFTSSFLLTGYVLNILPFLEIKRVMFIYHYAIALIFAVLMLAYLFDKQFDSAHREQFDSAHHKQKKPSWLLVCILVASVASFIFFAPLSYGLSLSPAQYHLRTWFGGWI